MTNKVAILIACTFLILQVMAFSYEGNELFLKRADPYDIKVLCRGYQFVNPSPYSSNSTSNSTSISKIKNGSTIDCIWRKHKSSNVTKVTSCELYTLKGYISTLWDKGVKFPKNKVRTHALVKIVVPSNVKLPIKVLLKAPANTEFGPHCSALSQEFIVY